MKEEQEKTLYELGFHLIPSLSPEEAAAAFEKITALIEGEGGSVKVSIAPQDRALSYEMSKEVAGKKIRYNNAYFASISFEGEKEGAPEIDKKMKADKNVLRYLLISLPKEALLPRERRIPTAHREEVKRTVDKSEGPVDESSIDKTIEGLVIE